MIKVETLNNFGHFHEFICKCGHGTQYHVNYNQTCIFCDCKKARVSFISLIAWILGREVLNNGI